MSYLDQRANRNEAGAALVEFVLVLPLLLVLLLGMLDLGKAFNYWIDETHLAHEGARRP
jgi:Flp pilus assembly protein TadG